MERIVERVDSHIPAQPRALRVCAYARVSSGKDAMLHSLSAQVSYYSNLIQNHSGWLYCGVYSDEAMTGTKSQRDDFQRMIEDCRKGKIDLIITKSISRFARNTVTLLQTVRELKSMGIDVYFEEQHIHTISADGELMMTILASYAQEESLSASENQKWRVRKAFENGELINLRFLFGYSITADGVQINEKEAAIIPLCIVLVSLVCLISGIFKYKMIAVASNSMLPVISRGDAIIYEKIDNAKLLKKGDILIFVHDNTTYVHRIVDITKKNNKIIITTKGDNNATNDAFLTTEDSVVGVVRYEITSAAIGWG